MPTTSTPTSATRKQRASASPYARAVLVLALVLALDQLTKRLVAHSIVPGERIAVLPGVHLVHTRNHGVAFGLEAGRQTLVAILVGLALLGLLVYFATHSSRPLLWLATGLLLGGALGNLLDRIRTGAVVDFVQLPLGWPPFNLADASIVLGVVLLLFAIESSRTAAHAPAGPSG